MAVFTVGGRTVTGKLFYQEAFFLAVGVGSPTWDTTLEAPSPALADLVDPVGVTRCREIAYVIPSETGDIVTSDGAKFERSENPSRYVYMEFKLDLHDAEPNTLRESGIYHGTEIEEGIPAGQFWIPEADVIEYGTLIYADRFNSIVRDGTIEQSFSCVLTM
jgi:hypothetical protein